MKHITKLTKQDIIFYSKKNNIDLIDNDIDTIYNYIKNDYKKILYNYDDTINDIRTLLDSNVQKKVEDLYTTYYQKYKHYL